MPTRRQPESVPKYVRLADQLRREIRSARLRPGDRLPSLVELKAQYGACQSTATRAHEILEQERLVVREPNRGIFVADPAARPPVGAIGFVVGPSVHEHPYYIQLFRGIQEEVLRYNVELLVMHDKSEVSWRKVDGVLMLSNNVGEEVQRLPQGMAYIALLYRGQGVASGVVADDYGGVVEAMGHLLGLGHRRIALLGAKDDLSERRRAAYDDELRNAGIAFNPGWVRELEWTREFDVDQFFRASGRQTMLRWLQQDWRDLGCTAILAQNDETAIGLVEAFEEAGIDVPAEVSVVGFDGTELSTFVRPRLTTVEVPLKQIGVTAVRKLLAAIEELRSGAAAGGPVITELPTRLVVRESTAVAVR